MNGGFTFSAPLRLRLITYFREKFDTDMTDDEANLFLGSLARVYDALTKPGLSEGVSAGL
jgi:hypothetical protein